MEIDGDVEGLRRLEDRPELGIIQIFALGMRIDERAATAQFPHGAHELVSCGARCLRGDGRQSSIACRIAVALSRDEVIGLTGELSGLLRWEDLHSGREQSEYLGINPCLFHALATTVAEVE